MDTLTVPMTTQVKLASEKMTRRTRQLGDDVRVLGALDEQARLVTLGHDNHLVILIWVEDNARVTAHLETCFNSIGLEHFELIPAPIPKQTRA